MLTRQRHLIVIVFTIFLVAEISHGMSVLPRSFSKPTITDDYAVFVDDYDILICYDLKNRKILWEKKFEERIFVYSANKDVVLVKSSSTATVELSRDEDRSTLYFNDIWPENNYKILAFHTETGELIEQFALPAGIGAEIISNDRAIIYQKDDGAILHCFDYRKNQSAWEYISPNPDAHLTFELVDQHVFVGSTDNRLGSITSGNHTRTTGIDGGEVVCLTVTEGKLKWRESLLDDMKQQIYVPYLSDKHLIGQWAVCDIGKTWLIIDRETGNIVTRYQAGSPYKYASGWGDHHIVIAFQDEVYSKATFQVLELPGMQMVKQWRIECRLYYSPKIVVIGDIAIYSGSKETKARDLTTDQTLWSKPYTQTWRQWTRHDDLLYFTDHIENKDSENVNRLGFLNPQTGKETILLARPSRQYKTFDNE